MARPPLPDPRLVRRIIRQRQLRARFFDGDLRPPILPGICCLISPPVRAEHTRVSGDQPVHCQRRAAPPPRCADQQMTDSGPSLMRVEDETDRRRAFITLTVDRRPTPWP
ncbi:MAG: hypothetical protein IPM87_11230, partial [Novosphingobium sp.]|nr:hypothetical protein [Novosphingobium sp.]